MESSFNLSLFFIVVAAGFQSRLIQGTAEEVWSDCPQNLTAYEGCPYTVHAIFTAADGRDCKNDYKITIGINDMEYHSNSNNPLMTLIVDYINGSSSQCNVSVTKNAIEDIGNNVTFTAASSFSQTPQIYCEDFLEVVNGNLSAPTNLNAIVTCDQLQLSWTQPNNLLEGYSIDNYVIVINGRSYFTNDTSIAISITDAELAINGEYTVSVTPSYCRGEGMTANTTVVIATRPEVLPNVTFIYFEDFNDQSSVLVQLTTQVADSGCHPISLTINYSCGNIMDRMPMQDVIVNNGTITTNMTLPIDQECRVELVFSNMNSENTSISTIIYADNLVSCSIQPTLDLVFFECNCIHNYHGCCNVRAIAHDNIRTYDEVCTDGAELSYLQLPTGDYSIECYNENTSKVVNMTNVIIRRRNVSCAKPTSNSVIVTSYVLPSSSDATTQFPSISVSPSIDQTGTSKSTDECLGWYIGLAITDSVLVVFVIILVVLCFIITFHYKRKLKDTLQQLEKSKKSASISTDEGWQGGKLTTPGSKIEETPDSQYAVPAIKTQNTNDKPVIVVRQPDATKTRSDRQLLENNTDQNTDIEFETTNKANGTIQTVNEPKTNETKL